MSYDTLGIFLFFNGDFAQTCSKNNMDIQNSLKEGAFKDFCKLCYCIVHYSNQWCCVNAKCFWLQHNADFRVEVRVLEVQHFL